VSQTLDEPESCLEDATIICITASDEEKIKSHLYTQRDCPASN